MNDIISILSDNWTLLLIGQYPHGPLGGLAITFLLSLFGIALAFPLGVILALCRVSIFAWLRIPALCIIYVARGVPLIMFIFWTYFFMPILLGRPVSGFTTMLVTIIVYQAAYLAEIIRAGIEGLPNGQTEAARSVGLSYMQTMIKVILPQAIYNMTPAMIGQFSSTIKDTALAYVISVNEITLAANQINGTLLTKPFQVFVLLAMIYFVLCFSLSQLARLLETRITKKRAKAVPVSVVLAPSVPLKS